ncbi:hypothetical protein HRG_012092 [Hirsutella rhossiliensis]
MSLLTLMSEWEHWSYWPQRTGTTQSSHIVNSPTTLSVSQSHFQLREAAVSARSPHSLNAPNTNSQHHVSVSHAEPPSRHILWSRSIHGTGIVCPTPYHAVRPHGSRNTPAGAASKSSVVVRVLSDVPPTHLAHNPLRRLRSEGRGDGGTNISKPRRWRRHRHPRPRPASLADSKSGGPAENTEHDAQNDGKGMSRTLSTGDRHDYVSLAGAPFMVEVRHGVLFLRKHRRKEPVGDKQGGIYCETAPKAEEQRGTA